MQRAHVLEKIEVLIASVISELRCGQSPAFHFSSRRRANTRFDSEQHQIVLKNTNERHLVTVSLRIAPKQFGKCCPSLLVSM
jgi:DNA topoisomerase VI subunit A